VFPWCDRERGNMAQILKGVCSKRAWYRMPQGCSERHGTRASGLRGGACTVSQRQISRQNRRLPQIPRFQVDSRNSLSRLCRHRRIMSWCDVFCVQALCFKPRVSFRVTVFCGVVCVEAWRARHASPVTFCLTFWLATA